MLVDNYNRHITYLRVSVTDNCNFNCIYCSPQTFSTQLQEIPLEDFLRIIRVFATLGITRVRLTGGEPFLRNGIIEFISELRKLNLEVAITTNASLLNSDIIDKLLQFNITRYNISLDTINKERFWKITNTNLLTKVLENIKLLSSQNVQLKLNCVLLNGINTEEIFQLIEFAGKHKAIIRFIELMPVGMNTKNLFYSVAKIINELNCNGKIKPYTANTDSFGPGKYFLYNETQIIGFITPLSNPFCKSCNRLRLTSRLTLRSCLGYNYEVDLKGITSDGEIKSKIFEALQNKPKMYSFDTTVKDCMRSIGG